MTLKDAMPFGKYKGLPIGELPKDYIRWLADQDWFIDEKSKWKDVAALLSKDPKKVAAVSTPKETERDSIENEVLARADEDFRVWWESQYGKRLREAKSDHYIPYLRLTLEAWLASRKVLTDVEPLDTSPEEPDFDDMDEDRHAHDIDNQ